MQLFERTQEGEKYGGMTVNERLFSSGLLKEFDNAVAIKNVERIVQILKQVEITDENIKPILDNYGLVSA